jgi:hypothetical protein
MMTSGVAFWWMLLCAVGLFNGIAWWLSARALQRRRGALSAHEYTLRKRLLYLSALYVLGCAYRSAFPVFDVPRIVLVDSFLSSVAVGRSVATIAELAFVAQWALLLRESARSTGSMVGKITALALVPLIAIAECCSWYSVLTTSNLGHTAEESLWALAAAALVVSLLVIRQRCTPKQRPVLTACCIAAAAYLCFMVFIDVPMYAARWVADGHDGRHYLSIAAGLKDAATRWTVSYRWQDWQTEVVWMALYFSVCVWVSISLVHAPLPRSLSGTAERKRLPRQTSLFPAAQ